MTRTRALSTFAGILALLVAQTLPVLAGPDKVGSLLKAYLYPEKDLFNPHQAQETDGVLGMASSEKGIRVLIHGDVSREELEAQGVTITSRAGNVFSAWIPAEKILAVSDLHGMIRIQGARKYEPNLDVVTADADVRTQVWGAVAPPYPGNSGAGAILGVVDTGFDYTHDDFRTAGGNSRFHAIWDQTVSGTPPSGFSTGHLWNQASLDNLTATTNDIQAHGTHVMGIGGGNGRGTDGDEPQYKYAGMAPEATLIGVKTTFFDTDILDGVNWIFQEATALSQPCVVNLSLGSDVGPHDGTDPFEVGLDALTGPGKIVVTSAGNARGAQAHAQGSVPSSGSPSSGILEFDYTISAYSARPGTVNDFTLFTGWYESTDQYDVTVITPNGFTFGPITQGTGVVQSNTNDGAIQIDFSVTNSEGDREVFIVFFDQVVNRRPVAGTWIIRFERVTSTQSNIDMWNFTTIPGVFTSNFTDDVTVSSPGTGLQMIAVGAYNTKTFWRSTDGFNYQYIICPCTSGEVAPFSSRGPSRDGRQKPEFSAPGFGVMSTFSDDVPVTGSNRPLISPDDHHWLNQGTSMSAPAVAGVVALVLANNPTFTPAEMKAHLISFARSDILTGTVPNYDYGYGRIGGEAADATPPSVTLSQPVGGEVIPTGSPYNITWNASDNFEVASVDLSYSDDGGSTWMDIATGEPNDGIFSWTPQNPTGVALVQVCVFDGVGNENTDMSASVFQIAGTVDVPESGARPVFMLGPSWPNPITGAARAEIQFGLTREGPARISVFNAAGRLVDVIADGRYPAGTHRVRWDARAQDGSRVASGQYYYRLETEEGTISQKLLVLK